MNMLLLAKLINKRPSRTKSAVLYFRLKGQTTFYTTVTLVENLEKVLYAACFTSILFTLLEALHLLPEI